MNNKKKKVYILKDKEDNYYEVTHYGTLKQFMTSGVG